MSDLLREVAREALAALAPFAGCETRDDGEPRRDSEWPPMRERVKDWFAWEDFRAAVQAFDHLREALAVEPEYEYRAVVAKQRRPELSDWYGGQYGEATARGILADQLGSAGLLTGWVERRTIGRPERVS